MIHPAIRIVLLCVFVASSAAAGTHGLAAGGGLLVLVYAYCRVSLRPAWVMLKRLRWFLLSILAVFLWLTPGIAPVWLQPLGEWAPTLEGLRAGGLRVAALAVIVVAVNLLLQTTSREQLLAGLYWLASALRSNDVGQRFAVRALLVMDRVALLQRQMHERRERARGQGRVTAQLRDLAIDVVRNVLNTAENEQLQTVVIDRPVAPPLAQWVLPVAAGALLLMM